MFVVEHLMLQTKHARGEQLHRKKYDYLACSMAERCIFSTILNI
jgi:hypothetical protein